MQKSGLLHLLTDRSVDIISLSTDLVNKSVDNFGQEAPYCLRLMPVRHVLGAYRGAEMAFDQIKTAQAAAWLLKTCGTPMDVLKLMKLLYLCDREALDRYGYSISGDRMVSMPHGPVLSQTLDLINGAGKPVSGGWDDLFSDRAGHQIALRNPEISRDDVDELSEVDLEVLATVCERFGGMSKWALRDYTHEHCDEWVDPCGSSYPISYKSLFLALGRPSKLASEMERELRAQDKADFILSRL